jgi:hypothetical protein
MKGGRRQQKDRARRQQPSESAMMMTNSFSGAALEAGHGSGQCGHF